MTTGEVLKLLRIANNYSISYLSKVSEFNRSFLCDLEHSRKNLTINTLCVLSSVYGIPYYSFTRLFKEFAYLEFENTIHFK